MYRHMPRCGAIDCCLSLLYHHTFIFNYESCQAFPIIFFYGLFMIQGFEEMKQGSGSSPISGVMERPIPPTLEAAARGISDAFSISTSRDKGSQLASSKVGSPVRPMSPELYAAIMLYTGNSIYRELNRYSLFNSFSCASC
jgi:hypothetical protein